MTFAAPFSGVITRPFGGAPATSSAWWLSGGIAAANCIAAYQPKGAADLATSLVNLANPGTNDCTYTTAPDFTSSGWVKKTNSFLYTGLYPSTGYSMLIRFSNVGGIYLCGVYASSKNFYSAPLLNATEMQNGSGGAQPKTTKLAAGIITINGGDFWSNDTKYSENATPTYTSALEFVFFAVNNGSPVLGAANGSIINACVIYNAKITDAQVIAVQTAMAAL